MHNVILIIVWSDLVSCFQSCSSCHISRFERLHLFLFRSSKLSALSRRDAPSKSSQGFTLCFQLLFPLLFFYYRSSSWRLYMMVHQGFFSFFICSSRFLSKLRPVKPYFKINMVLNTCFVLRSSSILHLTFRSAILSTLSFEMVLCHPWQFLLVLHDSQSFQEWHI